MLTSIIFAAVLAATAQANHRITLRNNCPFKVSLTLSNFPPGGADYTGGVSKTLLAFGKAPCSMTEWTFDSAKIGGRNDYDISNIQGFSVVCASYAMSFFILWFDVQAQKIVPGNGCSVVKCSSAKCPCDQAYRPGDTSGTCGGTGPVDQATRVCGASAYTVVYCP
ncbi:hypothetical protein FB451DRAFT_1460902 [Mycena latifolia]|nr:hypothetical protein FB451DRAFT_1460902 [Mycena latifolia]